MVLESRFPRELKRRSAYEAGTRSAQRAMAIEPPMRTLIYLYDANFGSAAQFKSVMASAQIRDGVGAWWTPT